MKSLSNKLAIITGVSRQKGIGAATAKELAMKGAHIFFTYWTPYDQEMEWGQFDHEISKIKEEILSQGVRCEHIELDLRDPSSLYKLFQEVERKFNQPADILINNACYSVNTSLESLTADLLDRHYEINVRATTLLCAQFVERFHATSGGRIVNLTTGWKQGTMPQELPYALTKSSIDTLTYTLAPILASKGVTINAVNPGPTDTGWMTEEIKAELTPRFPMGRIGQPGDVAKLISFLVSKEAEWVTGQIIHSEGGFLNKDEL